MFFGCEKEKIQIVEKEYNWKTCSGFEYENVIQMNSYATTDKLFILGHNTFTTIVADSLGQHIESQYVNSIKQPIDTKLPISHDFFISYLSNTFGKLFFFPTTSSLAGASYQLNLDLIDSTFQYFSFIHYTIGECISINNNNQVLFAYTTTDPDAYMKLLLVDSKVSNEFYNLLDTVKTQIFVFNDDPTNSVSIKSFDEYFYASTNDKTYRIDSKGEFLTVLDESLLDIFESNNELYGLGYNSVFISSNEGLTWNKGYTILPDYLSLSYSEVANKIIGYRNSQIFEITANHDSISGKELDNDGLIGKTITSISEFKGRVYITTLSGVYYKTIDDFFKEKTIEE